MRIREAKAQGVPDDRLDAIAHMSGPADNLWDQADIDQERLWADLELSSSVGERIKKSGKATRLPRRNWPMFSGSSRLPFRDGSRTRPIHLKRR